MDSQRKYFGVEYRYRRGCLERRFSMLKKLDVHKKFYGNVILSIFVLVLVTGTVMSEFFRTPEKVNIELEEYRNLFVGKYLETVTNIILKNKLGIFQFHRSSNEMGHMWIMQEPRQFPADNEVMRKIISSLGKIKIREIYPSDPIYHANYSLDEAQVELVLRNSGGNENVVKFGLVNPIDNTMYIYFSRDDAIYHVDALTYGVESLNITDFVDARVFALSPGSISSLAVYRGTKRGAPLFSMKRDENKWVGKRDRELDTQKVLDYLNRLVTIKSLFIFDKTTEELQRVLDKLLSAPTYSVEIEDINRISYSYKVMAIDDKLPGLKLEKKTNFIVKASNRDYPYLVDKDFLGTFL